MRQWVLTLPYRLRYLLAWNHQLCRAVLAVHVRAVLGLYRRRARRRGVLEDSVNFGRLSELCPLVTDFSSGSDMILARGNITAMSELAGKRVAAEPESVGMFVLARGLAREGLPFSAVAVVATDQTDMARSLDSGWVDAAVTYPPVSFEILQIPGTRVLFSSADIPREVVNVVALAGDVLERRLDDAARIVRAWDQGLAYAAEHPNEARELMASRERISVEEFGEALAGITLLTSNEQQPLFEPGGPLAKAVGATGELLRATAQIRNGSASAECLAPEPLARAKVRG